MSNFIFGIFTTILTDIILVLKPQHYLCLTIDKPIWLLQISVFTNFGKQLGPTPANISYLNFNYLNDIGWR